MNFKQRIIAYMEQEWGSYVSRFSSLPKEEGLKRVNNMGYKEFRDLLAHIVAWWEEGIPIVLAIADEREYERKKYDFDVFNAEAVAKYESWEGERFMTHFEEVRLKTAADLRSMKDAAFENRRIKSWLHGIIIHHAREHLLVPSRFLTEDTLEYEWAEYTSSYQSLPPERQAEWLKGQGFARFADIVAHILGWWEEGLNVIGAVLKDPGFKERTIDTDQFNAELVKKYSSWSETDIFVEFEKARVKSLEFVRGLSDDDYETPVIADWLVADFIEHIDEH
jgi:hypothetical protein